MLKLIALDEDDLQVVSAHVQDAILKAGELEIDAAAKRFVMPMRRFVRGARRGFFKAPGERHLSVLDVQRVLGVKATGIDRSKPDTVLSLLAIQFEPGDQPAGTIEMVFSGNATIRLEVECIEVRLADTGAAWDTPNRPSHGA